MKGPAPTRDLPEEIKITGVSNKVFTVNYVECAHDAPPRASPTKRGR